MAETFLGKTMDSIIQKIKHIRSMYSSLISYTWKWLDLKSSSHNNVHWYHYPTLQKQMAQKFER